MASKTTRDGEGPATFERLLAIETDHCVNWPLGTSMGYGSINYHGKYFRVHRLALLKTVGDPPSHESRFAIHRCGNPLCMNTRHLRWGTQKQNAADRITHGTDLRGEEASWSILTEYQVLEIVRRRQAGDTGKALADELGVSQQTVCDIVKGRHWSWLTGL